ncbi:MAG TPA: permease-like cell division protein FtsX [Pseudonocardiaceae bacterium]|jgi:cell division transport system permease protein|nr:permease-like cell division protein FtsX [Pseudonocardiaceae bacterium]
MRASFVFSEVITGLRRNITMTIAMILTTAISLGLLGGGLLIVRTIGKMQANFLSALQVEVNLDDAVSADDPNCTQSICAGLRADLTNYPGVVSVQFQNRQQTFTKAKAEFSNDPEMEQLVRPEAFPSSLLVSLQNPTQSGVISAAFANKAGVRDVDDQGVFVQKLTDLLNGVRNATFLIALIQALAALMLISNTIQVSAFTRRTEVGIMRLVGATRWYTQLPFLLEAVVAGVVGAVLAVGGLIVAKVAFLDNIFGSVFSSTIIPKIGLLDIASVSPWLLLAAVGISALTGYVTLRLYVRL